MFWLIVAFVGGTVFGVACDEGIRAWVNRAKAKKDELVDRVRDR